MTPPPPNIPLILRTAWAFLPDLLEKNRYSRAGCLRGMRSDRRVNFFRLLSALLCSVSLQHSGALCIINGRYVRPITREDMARKTGLSIPTIDRLLEQLRAWGYLESKQIKRKNKINGIFEVSPGLRFFTDKFWKEFSLLDMFKKSVSWAKKHCSRSFSLKFKSISLKSRELFSTVKEVLHPVLKALNPKNEKIQVECHKILNMLRKRE